MPVVDAFPPAPLALSVTFLGHASLVLTYGDTVVHVDPVGQFGDYGSLPKADIILVTHEHSDHLDPAAISAVRKPVDGDRRGADLRRDAPGCRDPPQRGLACRQRDPHRGGARLQRQAHARPGARRSTPKGAGSGYVLTLGERKVYVAGDTENTAEMKGLKGIDIAFLPMNLPYTITPEMVADAAKGFRPMCFTPTIRETRTHRQSWVCLHRRRTST